MRTKSTRIISAILSLVMVLGAMIIMPLTASAEDATGTVVPEGVGAYNGSASGQLTQDSDGTYLIQSAADLVYFQSTAAASATETDVFKLTCDVAMNDASYTEKHSFATGISFAGTFDGDGHSIYNIYTNVGIKGAIGGFFDAVSGTIKNVKFVTPHVYNGSSSKGDAGGAVVGSLSGTLENVHLTGAYVKGRYAGGLVGAAMAGAVISECSVSGEVSGTLAAGGLVGVHQDPDTSASITINACINNAIVTATGGPAGGIIGADNEKNTAGYTITACVNNGAVTGTSEAGGVIGASYRAGVQTTITACTNNGTVTASTGNAGGIGGSLPSSNSGGHAVIELTSCINRGAVDGASNAGGMIGFSGLAKNTAKIYDSANFGSVTSLAGNAGGMVGNINSNNANYFNPLIVENSANYGNVTANIAGGIVGTFTAGANKSSNITVTGYLSIANITGTAKASAITGEFNYSYNASTANKDINLSNVWMQGEVSVAEGGIIAVFVASSTTTKTAVVGTPVIVVKDSGFDLIFKSNGTPVENIVSAYNVDGSARTGYNNGSADVTDAYPVASTATFATAALASLNAAAGEYTSWRTDDAYVIVHDRPALALSNLDKLSHGYTGSAIEAVATIYDVTIKTVDITYYTASDLTAPLASAPILPGNYTVVLQGKDEAGNNVGSAVSENFTIDKGDVSFVLDAASLAQLTHVKNNIQYKADFTGNVFILTAEVYNSTGGFKGETLMTGITPTKITLDGATVDSILQVSESPYNVTFDYAGNDLYKAGTTTYQITINKTTLSYPAVDAEGRWNIPAHYTGEEVQVTLNSLAGEPSMDMFDITYGGDYKTTNATAAGTTLTATATLALKAEYAEDCQMDGESPTYTVEWSLAKADTVIKLYDTDGNEVTDPANITAVFNGTAQTWTAKLVDVNGTILNDNLDTITTTNVGTATKTFTCATADDNHVAPADLAVSIEITPLTFEITTSTIAGKDYDGTGLSATGVEFFMTDTTGSTWNGYVTEWQRYNAVTSTWEVVTETATAGKYRLHVTRTVVADAGVTPNCTAEGYSNEITIKAREIRLPAVMWNYTTPFAYNGTEFSVDLVTAIHALKDDARIDFVISGNVNTAAGIHTAIAYIWTLSPNYELLDSEGNALALEVYEGKMAYKATLDWTVEKAVTDMSSVAFDTPQDTIYDGESHMVEATGVPSYVDVNYTITRDGEEADSVIDAGTYTIVATFTLNNTNYTDIDEADVSKSITFTIAKKKVTLPTDATIWNYTDALTYTGETLTVEFVDAVKTLKGIELDYVITGNTGIGSDSYSATAYIWAFSANYELTDSEGTALTLEAYEEKQAYKATLAWAINKAPVDLSGITMEESVSVVYDGKSHKVDVTGVPDYINVSTVITKGEETVTEIKNVGTYNVTVTFSLKNTNYMDIPQEDATKTCTVTVTPKIFDPSTYTFTDTTAEYDGKKHTVKIKNLDSEIKVTSYVYYQNGKEVDAIAAGTYEVVANLAFKSQSNSNFQLTATTVTTTLTITPATYSASVYDVGNTYTLVFNDEIKENGADFITIINELLANLGRTLPAGNTITIANASEMPVMKSPGTETFTLSFTGSANYEPITDTVEVTLVVQPITVTPSGSDITITFPEGMPEDATVKVESAEVTEDMTAAMEGNEDITFGNATIYKVWNFSAKDDLGDKLDTVDGTCEWTISIPLDEDAKAAFADGTFHIAKVVTAKNGTVSYVTFKSYDYNEATGVLTLKLNTPKELNATYALAIPGTNIGLIIGIIAAVVVLLGGAAVAVVIIMKRKHAPAKSEPAETETEATEEAEATETAEESSEATEESAPDATEETKSDETEETETTEE